MRRLRWSLSALALLACLGGIPVALTGCSGSAPGASGAASSVSQAVADARIVADGVARSYAALRALYPQAVSPAADAQAQALLASLPGFLAQIQVTADAATNAAGVRGVESVAEQLLNLSAAVVAQVPGVSPGVQQGFQALAVLLPILELEANALVPAAARVGLAPGRFRSAMSPAEARAVLAR
jgi:hypothetical protein